MEESADPARPIKADFIHMTAVVYIWYTTLHFFRGNWCFMWVAMLLSLIVAEVLLHKVTKATPESPAMLVFLIPLFAYFFFNSYLTELASLKAFLRKAQLISTRQEFLNTLD